jgi:hypothetical protein
LCEIFVLALALVLRLLLGRVVAVELLNEVLQLL